MSLPESKPAATLALRSLAKRALLATVGSRIVRRLLTSNYNSGLVALGECNHYLFPARFVTVDMGPADFPMSFLGDFRLPFATGSQSVVYASHVLEHVGDQMDAVLREVHRILKPGGGLRIEVPDSEVLIDAYVKRDPEILAHFRAGRARLRAFPRLGNRVDEDQLTVVGEIGSYNHPERGAFHIPVYATADELDQTIPHGIEAVETLVRSKMSDEEVASGGHNNALYWEGVERRMKAAGFSRVEKVGLGRTTIPGLALGGGPARLWNRIREKRRRAFYSLYVEAIK